MATKASVVISGIALERKANGELQIIATTKTERGVVDICHWDVPPLLKGDRFTIPFWNDSSFVNLYDD